MTEQYDAVMASTGPSLEVDRKRADDAINAVIRTYGSVKSYNGLWIAAGTLGNQKFETAQRTRIYNRFLEVGARLENVRTIGGEDTMDKVRETISLVEKEGLQNVGISTYLLHYLRFKEGLLFAKKDGLAPHDLEFKLIWSPTTPWTRWHKDFIYGVMGLGIEAIRLGKYGFTDANQKHKPLKDTFRPVQDWVSDGEDNFPHND